MKFEQMELELRASKTLNNMMKTCANDMVACGIPVRADRVIKVNVTNLKGTRACCFFKQNADGEMSFMICIDKKVLKHLDNDAVMANVKNSMYHELLHTCEGCHNGHGAEFVKWSKVCDKNLGTHTLRHMEEKVYYNPNARHIVYVCPHCGNEYWAVKGVDDTTCEICGAEMH